MKFKLIIFLLLMSTIVFFGCDNKIFTRSNIFLDTIVEITIYNGGSEQVLEDCFKTIEKYDGLLNSYDENSQLNEINTEFKTVDSDVYELIQRNYEFYNLSKDYFSPFLGNVIELWDFSDKSNHEIPNPDIVNNYLKQLEGVELEFSPQNYGIKINKENIKINLGATAKGFVADKLKQYLLEKDVTSAIINLGGNVNLVGDRNGQNFSVGIDSPEIGINEPIGSLSLSNKSIVTSGYSQRYFFDTDGNFYHHILDPKTGFPVNSDLKQVVIVSDSSLVGDYLSTTCFVMGEQKALDFLNELNIEDDLGYILINTKNEITVSNSLKNNFSLFDEFKEQYFIK